MSEEALDKILGKRRVSVTELAEMIGYGRCYVSSVLNGRVRGGKKIAKAIEMATNGAVTAHYVMNIPLIPAKSRGIEIEIAARN